jgi:hypothetical protein
MTHVEDVMRDEIRRDLDSTDSALQLLEMRKQTRVPRYRVESGGAGPSRCRPSRSGSKQTTGRPRAEGRRG